MQMKVFLDCMIYLHYRSVEELDLPSLLAAESVAIVIPRITLRELDKQKNTHPSSKVRDRARRVLKKIEQWTGGEASVRQGVSVEFFPVVPTIDYEKLGLNLQWSDDVLIATILEYQKIHSGTRVVLITQDSGPRLTARHVGIPVEELPAEMKLPEEPDPLEVENRELTRRLERVQSALPQLTVCFAGADEPQTHARFTFSSPSNTMEDDIASKMADLLSQLPKQHPPSAPASTPRDSLAGLHAQYVMMSQFDLIEPGEYERYNRAVDAYLAEYEQYMRETWEQKAALRRTIRFQIEVRNTGTAPAEDVDVEFHFPDGFDLVSEDDLPELPEAPSPPRQPRTRVQMMTEGIAHFSHLSIPSPAIAHFKMPVSFKIERTGSFTVTDHFARIKHGGSVKMPEIFLTFASYEAAGSFHCEYTIRPANLPNPIRGKLHIIIDKEETNAAVESTGEV